MFERAKLSGLSLLKMSSTLFCSIIILAGCPNPTPSVDVVEHIYMNERSCWIDKDKTSPFFFGNMGFSDIDLVVRTFNAWNEDPHHQPRRMLGLADAMFNDWEDQIGVVGLQELLPNRSCEGFGDQDISACFARYLENRFSKAVNSVQSVFMHDQAIVVGPEWTVVSEKEFELPGGTEMGIFGYRPPAYLLESKLKNVTKGWTLHFYVTHLAWPGAYPEHQMNRRHLQIDALLNIVDSRIEPGELPPILVGDMNFDPTVDTVSNNKLNSEFYLANRDAISCFQPEGTPTIITIPDQIWIGLSKHFTRTWGKFKTLRFHSTRDSAEGDNFPNLSDHLSPAVSLKVMGTSPPSPQPSATPRDCPANEKCCEKDDQGNCTLCVARNKSCPPPR